MSQTRNSQIWSAKSTWFNLCEFYIRNVWMEAACCILILQFRKVKRSETYQYLTILEPRRSLSNLTLNVFIKDNALRYMPISLSMQKSRKFCIETLRMVLFLRRRIKFCQWRPAHFYLKRQNTIFLNCSWPNTSVSFQTDKPSLKNIKEQIIAYKEHFLVSRKGKLSSHPY